MTHKQGVAIDKKWGKQMRHVDLMLKYMETRSELFDECPERMQKSEKKFAEKLLRKNIIKCEHE